VIALFIEQWVWKKEEGVAVLKNVKTLVLIIPICLAGAIITINRNNDWKDSATLYAADLEKTPNDARLNYYLGDELITNMLAEHDPVQRNLIAQDIIGYLQKAIAIYPVYEKAHIDLGITYTNISLFDSAEFYYLRSLQINPNNLLSINKLAHLYFITEKYHQAIEYNKRALVLNPDYMFTYSNIGVCYEHLGKFDSAILYAYVAINVDPKFLGSYEILANCYKALGKYDSASKYDALLKEYAPRQ